MNYLTFRSSRLVLLVLGCFTFSLTASAPAADWPRFRGPRGDGVSSDTNVPTEWNETSNLKWKLELPGAGFSSPIVVGDFVFVTCYSGAEGDLKQLQRHLVCVDRYKGEVAKLLRPQCPHLYLRLQHTLKPFFTSLLNVRSSNQILVLRILAK